MSECSGGEKISPSPSPSPAAFKKIASLFKPKTSVSEASTGHEERSNATPESMVDGQAADVSNNPEPPSSPAKFPLAAPAKAPLRKFTYPAPNDAVNEVSQANKTDSQSAPLGVGSKFAGLFKPKGTAKDATVSKQEPAKIYEAEDKNDKNNDNKNTDKKNADNKNSDNKAKQVKETKPEKPVEQKGKLLGGKLSRALARSPGPSVLGAAGSLGQFLEFKMRGRSSVLSSCGSPVYTAPCIHLYDNLVCLVIATCIHLQDNHVHPSSLIDP